MPVFVDPRGKEFEVPSDPTPEEQQQIQQMGLKPKPNTMKDVLQALVSGGLEGVVRAPLIGGDIMKLGMVGLNKIRPGTFEDETVDRFGSQKLVDILKATDTNEALGSPMGYEPQTTAGRYTKAGTEAVTGAATTGGVGAIPGLVKNTANGLNAARVALSPSSMAINAGAGMAGELGSDMSGGNPLVGMVFGLGAGTAGNLARNGLFRYNFPQQLHDATKGMTDQDWNTAGRSLRDFKDSGSKTYTLADIDPLQPRIGGVAQGISNSTGGDMLRQRLSVQERRNKDIPELMARTVDGITGLVDAREIAETLSKQGEQTIRDKLKPLYVQRDGMLQGDVDPQRLLAATNRYVRRPRFDAHNQSTGQRYTLDKAEESLLGKDALKTPLINSITPPVLNLQSLSQNVKSLRKIPQSPTDNPGANVQRFQAEKAGEAAEQALDKASRGQFGNAMRTYGQAKQNIIDPLKRGLPGQIQGAADADGLIARLRKVPVDKLQAELNTMGVTPDQAKAMARIIGERLGPIPDKTNALGTTESLDRKIFQALVDYGAPQAAGRTNRNLGVADSLSRLSAEHATDRTMGMHLSKNAGSTLINPFGSASMDFRLRRSSKETQSLSELLSNPTPENLVKLREMSKIDPRAKRALEWISSLSGIGQSAAHQD